MNATELRTATSLALVYMLRMLGLFMVMPVLAIFAVNYPDYSPLLVGLAIGGYGLTQALLQIPMGVLSDKIGRKPVILLGLLLFALGSFVAAQAETMVYLLIGRLLQGAGAIAGAIMALAGDLSRDDQRSKVMAIIGIAIGFSFYLAVIIGPLIAATSFGGGLRGIFLLTGLLSLCCIPLIIWVVPSVTSRAPTGDTLPVINDLLSLVSHPQLRRLNLSVLLLHLMITLLFTQLPMAFSHMGLDVAQQWQFYLPVLVGSIIGLLLLMRIAASKGQIRVMQLCVLLLAMVFAALLLVSSSFAPMFILALLFFTGFNYLEANFPALVSTLAPAGKKGSAMGIYASFQFFGAFSGGAISGLLASWFEPSIIYIIASIVCLAWLLILQGLRGEDRLKRYTLSVNLANQSAQQVVDKLANLAGVRDITLVAAENAAYLKVDGREFNLQQAKQSIQAEQ